MSFKFIDLFAGIGGFHIALKKEGGKCVFASEIDKFAKQIYMQSFKNSKNILHGDVNDFVTETNSKIPDHDVLTAGFPCQPFSKSGKQKGINETRGTLFWIIAKIIEHKTPRLILLENVRNLIGPKHKSDYLTMINILRQLGYAVSTEPTIISPHRLTKSQGGTPQHRERIYISGYYVGSSKKAFNYEYIEPLINPGDLNNYKVPNWNLNEYLIPKISHEQKLISKLSDEEELSIEIWSDFVDRIYRSTKEPPPSFPIWTEFFKLRKHIRINSETPDWKKNFILWNSEFYENNQKIINDWLKFNYNDWILLNDSKKKFEWQAGKVKKLSETLLQFRPSGLRAKKRNYVPAFVAITQTTILAKEKRRLLVEEVANLQGMGNKINFKGQDQNQSFKQLGNAVHVGMTNFVFRKQIERASHLGIW